MKVQIKSLSGASTTIDGLRSTDTVLTLKKRYAKNGPPAAQQRIIFANRELSNEDTLLQAKIGDGAVLSVVLRTKAHTAPNAYVPPPPVPIEEIFDSSDEDEPVLGPTRTGITIRCNKH